MNDGAALGLVLDQVSKDKNIDRAVLVETLEQAILTAAKRAFGMQREMEAKFNEETGRVDLFQIIIIMETVTPGNEGKEVLLADAQRVGLKTEVGDELLFQILRRKGPRPRAGRQVRRALKLNRPEGVRSHRRPDRQVILQVREAERENVFNQYKDRKGELISGSCAGSSAGTSSSTWGGGGLPVRDQCRAPTGPRPDRRVRGRHRQDRARPADHPVAHHKGCSELFEMESPRSTRKIVRIEAWPARQARARRRGQLRDRDATGRRLRGHEGSRVQAVVRAAGEDRHRPLRSIGAFVCSAIAPAVAQVIIDAGATPCPDRPRREAVAHRQEGQNVRLASQLKGWRIDIHPVKVRRWSSAPGSRYPRIAASPELAGFSSAGARRRGRGAKLMSCRRCRGRHRRGGQGHHAASRSGDKSGPPGRGKRPAP
jgi:N utilization substance protein A